MSDVTTASSICTPSTRPLLADDPSTWTNSRVEAYIVQAVPAAGPIEHSFPPLQTGCCARDGESCPGTSDAAVTGVHLDRDEALHAITHHFSYANWSLCRFVSHGSPQYVCDLVFEIDAHASAPRWRPDVEFYEPAIKAAVTVGRRVYDYLVDTLEVDARYITVAITRMGARVTVDWRAFGPQRLHRILAVLRYVETQVFAEGELEAVSAEFAEKMRVETDRVDQGLANLLGEQVDPVPIKASVTIDGGIYVASEASLVVRETATEFRGPCVRPLGALHSASHSAALYFRTTPVPRQRFRPEEAAWLTRVSRSEAGPHVADFPEPALFFVPWPETRRRAGDRIIEGDLGRPRLPLATKLIELFEAWETLPLPDHYRADVNAQHGRTKARRHRTGKSAEVTPEMVDDVVRAVAKGRVRRRKERYRFPCPYCLGRGSANQGTVFIESGVFNCFSDNCAAKGGVSLYQLAADHGVGHLVPFRTESSTLVRRVPLKDLEHRSRCRQGSGRCPPVTMRDHM